MVSSIEDDLGAHPARLRAEIRRLRAALPENQRHLQHTRSVRDEACLVLARYLCPFPNGTGCACFGGCHARAGELMDSLEAAGLVVGRVCRC